MSPEASKMLGRRAGASRPKRQRISKWRLGQATVEYLLTTVLLVTIFAGMYGFMQQQLRALFIQAGMKILGTYY